MEATKGQYYYGTGRRKTATARVRVYPGKGANEVNSMAATEYLKPGVLWEKVTLPLKMIGKAEDFYVTARVSGGGMNAQADAIRHGIARALVAMDETLKPTLKKAKLLTRDPRVKERKKYGLKRARRAPQFSKR